MFQIASQCDKQCSTRLQVYLKSWEIKFQVIRLFCEIYLDPTVWVSTQLMKKRLQLYNKGHSIPIQHDTCKIILGKLKNLS